MTYHIKQEQNQLEGELEKIEGIPSKEADVGKIARDIIETMGTFEDIFKEGTLEEKKEFIRLFIEKIELDTKREKACVHIRKFPVPQHLVAGNSPFQLVAGVWYKQQKARFPPIDVVELPLESRPSALVPAAA